MKVVQINCLAQTGSTGRMVYQLAQALQENDDTCAIAYSSGSSTWPDSFRYTNEAERKFHALLSRVTGEQGYFTFVGTRRLVRWLRGQKPDVVHLHNLHDNNIQRTLLFRYLAQSGVSVVITLHDCSAFTGRCVHYTCAGCTQWQTQCRRCPQLHSDIPTWFFDRSATLFEKKRRELGGLRKLAVVGVSNWVTAEAKRSALLSGAHCVVRIYNWVDFSMFYPREKSAEELLPGLGGKHIYLSVAARWQGSKGLVDALAMARLLQADEQIVLVGQIPAETPLPANVTALGAVRDDAVLASLYSAADVLLNFSLQETFGLVTAEALACGTPVVARETTANPELVGPGCGEVVDADASPEAFYAAVRRVRAAGKAALGPQCTAFARENFSKEKNTAAYVRLYHALAEGEKECGTRLISEAL